MLLMKTKCQYSQDTYLSTRKYKDSYLNFDTVEKTLSSGLAPR